MPQAKFKTIGSGLVLSTLTTYILLVMKACRKNTPKWGMINGCVKPFSTTNWRYAFYRKWEYTGD